MTDARSSERAEFEEARSAFDKLDTQDKVAFVMEAALTTLGKAAEKGGRALADVLEKMAAEAARPAREAETKDTSGASSGDQDAPPPSPS